MRALAILLTLLLGCGPNSVHVVNVPLVSFTADAPQDATWRSATVAYVEKLAVPGVFVVVHGAPPIQVDPNQNLFHASGAVSLVDLNTGRIDVTAWAGSGVEGAPPLGVPVRDLPYELKNWVCKCEYALQGVK